MRSNLAVEIALNRRDGEAHHLVGLDIFRRHASVLDAVRRRHNSIIWCAGEQRTWAPLRHDGTLSEAWAMGECMLVRAPLVSSTTGSAPLVATMGIGSSMWPPAAPCGRRRRKVATYQPRELVVRDRMREPDQTLGQHSDVALCVGALSTDDLSGRTGSDTMDSSTPSCTSHPPHSSSVDFRTSMREQN